MFRQSVRNLATKRIDKILIANRGEIACRVIRSAKKLAIKTVAVYSDVDRDSMHVKMADEAFHIGGAASADSYLRKDRILDVCKRTGAQAVHPGYGFLSENAEFADLLAENGVIFIGPSTEAILDMGIKSKSKHIMDEAGVPIIKGYHGDQQDDATLLKESKKIGFPVMLKAIMGGGGKGMRICMNEGEFQAQLDSARREALQGFGDDRMLVEKFVEDPRHVEVQVFGDNYGDAVYLYERDCSVQRRHQKVLEEAPAPGISWDTRRAIGEAAVRAAKAVNYSGAGTVEFIMDKHENFYFMEMNTRLQVEHPVSEMITGQDLVEWQIRVARGEKIPLQQEDIQLNGHSIEARVYAEDPENGFLPGAGKLVYLKNPEDDEHTRVETGVRTGDDVSQYYDPMIAKLVVWGNDRQEALDRLTEKLSDYHVVGLPTNLKFLKRCALSKDFQEINLDTGFIERNEADLIPKTMAPTNEAIVTSALIRSFREPLASTNPFDTLINWRSNMPTVERFSFAALGETYEAKMTALGNNHYTVEVGGQTYDSRITKKEHGFTIEIDGVRAHVSHFEENNEFHLFTSDGPVVLDIPKPAYSKLTDGGASDGDAIAPMTGTITQVMVKAGDSVAAGDILMTMVAMKMEHTIKAPKDGVIKQVIGIEGETVDRKALLVKYEE